MGMGILRNRICPNGHRNKYKKCCWQNDYNSMLSRFPNLTMAVLRKQNRKKKDYKAINLVKSII